MTTYILRHGQTDYSRRYLVNGDPSQPIRLSDEGQRSLSRARTTLSSIQVRTWVASEFPRTQQTASLLMGYPPAELAIDARLNELDYGEYEGRQFLEYAAWLEHHGRQQRPPGARESQHEGIVRMLTGVLAAVERPGPRVVVCHGLLVSVLAWQRDRSPSEILPLFFPEAPCAEPMVASDHDLPRWIASLLNELDADDRRDPFGHGEGRTIPVGEGPAIATVGSVSRPPDQKDLPHA